MEYNLVRERIAMLTPSSNSVVEPWCYEILKKSPEISLHFNRVEVLRIDKDQESLSQFQDKTMLNAFKLLSHVKPSIIGWNGTSASWLGLDRDRTLIDEVYEATGCKVVTSSLSILAALSLLNVKKIGLVTPYVHSIQEQIIKNFESENLHCVSEIHFNLTDNFSFSEVSENNISNAVEVVIEGGAQAVIILCTNLAGTRVAPILEKKYKIPVLDSVFLTVWGAFRALNKDTKIFSEWAPILSKLM